MVAIDIVDQRLCVRSSFTTEGMADLNPSPLSEMRLSKNKGARTLLLPLFNLYSVVASITQ
jgi:hypothetical protein